MAAQNRELIQWRVVSQALFLLHLVIVAEGVTFTQQPSYVSALEKSPATMTCSISDLGSNHVVLWYRSGILLSNGTEIVGHDASRYAIMANRNLGQYNLHISAVSKSDDHTYRCAVNSIVQGTVTQVLRSNLARLEIYYLPDKTYPECKSLLRSNYTEGESITIECKSERANPPVTLTWKRGGQTISQVQIDDTTPGFRKLQHTFDADANLNGALFECHLSSEANATYLPHCTLGGLNILYPPRVILDGLTETIRPNTDAIYACSAHANPDTMQFKWQTFPSIPESRTRFSADKRQLIITAHENDNGTVIMCNATNSIGSMSASVVMTVLPPIPETVTTKLPVSTEVTVRPKTSTDIPDYKPGTGSSSSGAVHLNPEILAIIIGIIGLLILIVLVITLGYLCRCFPVQHKGTYDSSVYGSTYGPTYGPSERPMWDQTSIYFEPRDHLKELSTWQRTNRPAWQRNVSVQVPHIEEEEAPYAEIGQDWDDGTYTMQI